MNKYRKYLFIIFPLVLMSLLAFSFIYSKSIHTTCELLGEEKITLEYGQSYEDEGAKGTYSTLFTKNKEATIQVEGEVNEKKVGTYELVYKVSKFGHKTEVKRTVEIIDTIAPEIVLSTNPDYYCIKGEEYKEEGYKATDNYDGDITDKVTITNEEGVITYSVKDSSNNEYTITRTIRYDEAPTLTLAGATSMNLTVGSTYNEPGYSANDQRDGDLSSKVKVEGSVDINTAGTYTLTYSVTDQANNTTTATRTVTVSKPVIQPDNPAVGDKVVYLTFDDGPGPYTQRLLDILAKYNVKVTFFVTAQSPNYLSMLTKEAAAGHTVAIHTYSHNYASIYASTAAFYDDLYKMQSVIQQYTGIKTNLMRFPGGGSNGISKSYCPGIMTQLTSSVQANGFVYFDWNVTSGDAGGTTSAAGVAQNVINGIKSHSVSVVLQHDIKSFSVEATDQIISWGLSNGYTFLPLTSSSFTAHHRVNN